MTKFLRTVALAVISGLCLLTVLEGRADETNFLQPTTGLRVFNPAFVFSPDNPFDEDMPEIAFLNTRDNAQIRQIMWTLENKGVGYFDGKSFYNSGSFDLYSPFMILALDQPAAHFGIGPDSKVGISNFLLHDAVHQVIGTPGPRVADFKDIKAAKARMVKIILKEEALATAWTNFWYAQWWYKWKQASRPTNPDFDRYNQGAFSLGPVSAKEILELQLAVAEGRPRETKRIIQRLYSPEFYRQAVSAGAPGAIPNLENRLGKSGQHLFLRYLMPSFFAYYLGLIEPFYGYLSLKRYADGLAEYYYSEWYVKWADAFNYGLPLDEMEASLKRKMSRFVAGESLVLAEEPQTATFEFMYLRNYLAQFGRKLYELEYLLSRQPGHVAERKYVLNLQTAAVELYNQSGSLVDLKQGIKVLVQEASQLDMEHFGLPLRISDNHSFWMDPMAVLVPRPQIMSQDANVVSATPKLHEPKSCAGLLK